MPFELDSLGKTESKSTRLIWLETFGVSVLTVALGFLVRPDDPFFVHDDSFPWPIIAPVLVGLRYGFAEAFATALLIIVSSLIFSWWLEQPAWRLTTAYSLGMLVTGMLTGEFRDIWERRLRRLERSNEYRQARLEEFTRAYHVLKISHDRLEQDSAGKSTSLRSALSDMQRQLANVDASSDNLAQNAETILNVFSHYGVLQVASLHALLEDGVQAHSLAHTGDTEVIDPSDPLLRLAIVEKRLISVRADIAGEDEAQETDYLACIPLVDTYQAIHAVLVIKLMPFFSFHETNLKLMAIIAGRIADILMAARELPVVEDLECYEFFRRLKRSMADAREFQLPASLLIITATNPTTAPAYIQTIETQMRGLDIGYVTRNCDDDTVMLMLMPLTAQDGVASYLVRFEQFMRQQHGVNVDDTKLDIVQYLITPEDTVAGLRQRLQDEAGLREDALHYLDRAGPVAA
ncbi:MAG: PelD GGDEF domain-containing protein [Pseudomonadales bacterium]